MKSNMNKKYLKSWKLFILCCIVQNELEATIFVVKAVQFGVSFVKNVYALGCLMMNIMMLLTSTGKWENMVTSVWGTTNSRLLRHFIYLAGIIPIHALHFSEMQIYGHLNTLLLICCFIFPFTKTKMKIIDVVH